MKPIRPGVNKMIVAWLNRIDRKFGSLDLDILLDGKMTFVHHVGECRGKEYQSSPLLMGAYIKAYHAMLKRIEKRRK